MNISTICLKSKLNNLKGHLAEGQETITKINHKRGTLTLEKEEPDQKLKDLDKQYEKIRPLLERKGYTRKRRENVPTSHDMISANSSSARYRRRTETRNLNLFMVELKFFCIEHGIISRVMHLQN